MKKLISKEPLAVGALLVTLILHFFPGYTEIARWFQPREIEEITLQCTEPDPENILLYPGMPDRGGEARNHITFPITCRLFNNTLTAVSIIEYGPAMISNRLSSGLFFGESRGNVVPQIANQMSQEAIGENSSVPFLLSSNEVWEFNSLFALPYVQIILRETETCEEPTSENIDLWSGYICLSGQPMAFTNFLYTPLSVGFWDWDEYGQVVRLGDGREVFYSDQLFLIVAACGEEDPRTTSVFPCRESPRVLPPRTWTVRR